MFQNCVSFERATEMFYSMQYEEGLKIINECIEKDSINSILYSNRALFYSQLGQVEEGLSNLNLAIKLNYLNYIAYFNMFSLLMRIQKFDQAFQNLCCSLSCLYLMRAKTKKSQLDASKAIKYAQNNMEAHILKGLIHLQNGKFKLALNELDWVCEINPQHEIANNIRKMIFKIMNPGLQIDQSQFERDNDNHDHQKNQFVRLQSSYTFEENDKEKELRDCIIEFNEIYNNLNEFQGTITTKVNKQEKKLDQQNQPYAEKSLDILNQKPQKDVNIEQNNKNEEQKEEYLLFQEKQAQKSEEIHLEAAKNCLDEANTNHETLIDDSMMNTGKQNQTILGQNVTQKLNDHEVLIDEKFALQTQQKQSREFLVRASRQNSVSLNNSETILADDGLQTPSSASLVPEPGQYGSISQNLHLYNESDFSQNFKSFNSIQQKQSQKSVEHFSGFESIIHSHKSENIHSQSDQKALKAFEQEFESMVTENNHKENQEISMISDTLYPRPENALLQFSIIKLEILNMSKEQISEMKNLYCIANYLNVKEGASHSNFKLRTACQKGFNNGTEWNETFQPIEIPESPECMKIKVYNKKYSSYRDDLIGEMEVEITTHGLVKLPLFNKKVELSGSLFINLELVFPEIQEVDKVDPV